MQPFPTMPKGFLMAMAGLALFGATAAWAQDVKIDAPTPAREPRIITPGLLYETRPREESIYPGYGPTVPHDPAFIRPFTTEVETPTSTGRLGIAGWTAPTPPVGPTGTGRNETTGTLNFGFSWTWGGPPSRSRQAGSPDAPSALPR